MWNTQTHRPELSGSKTEKTNNEYNFELVYQVKSCFFVATAFIYIFMFEKVTTTNRENSFSAMFVNAPLY